MLKKFDFRNFRRKSLKQSRDIVIVAILAIITIFAIIIGTLVFVYQNAINTSDRMVYDPNLDESARDYIGDEQDEGSNGSLISVGGFGSLNFKAGRTNQRANFHNEAANNCYMVFELYLPDGTKIYESKLVEPGKAIYEINLNQKLSRGTYKNAKLIHRAYSMDGLLTTLNTAEIKFNLVVE